MKKQFLSLGLILLLLTCGCVDDKETTATTTEVSSSTTTTTSASPQSQTTATTAASSHTRIPFFGIEEDYIQENDIVSLTTEDIQELGAEIARTHGGPFVWDNVEPTKGTYDYSKTDKTVGEAADSEITLLASLWSYARWDQDPEKCKVGGKMDAVRDRVIDLRCPPQDREAHRQFLEDMVERYDGDNDYGREAITEELKEKIQENPVRYWEINNEVDIGDNIETAKFFQGTLEEYVELLKESYTTIKTACPDCQVLIAAPATDAREYYQEITRLGGDSYFDIVNIHCQIDELGIETKKPVIITEGGGQTGSEIAKGAIDLASKNVAAAMITMTPDKAKVELGGKDKAGGFLLDLEGRKTETYYAYKAAAAELAGFTSAQKTREDDVVCVKFSYEKREDKTACYAAKGKNSISLELGETKTITDLDGNKWTASRVEMEVDNVYFLT